MYYKHKKTKSYLKNVFVTQFSWQKKAFLAKFSSKISAKSKTIFLLKNDYWNWKNQGKEISPESNFAICEIMKYKFRHILTEKSQIFSFPHFPHFQIFGHELLLEGLKNLVQLKRAVWAEKWEWPSGHMKIEDSRLLWIDQKYLSIFVPKKSIIHHMDWTGPLESRTTYCRGRGGVYTLLC